MSNLQEFEEARNYFNLGVSASRASKWAVAKEYFLRAHYLMPERVSVLENLAKTLACLGEWQECETYMDRLRARDPKNINLLKIGGLRSAARGRYDEALTNYEAVVELGKSCAEDFYNLGRVKFTWVRLPLQLAGFDKR
jgi:tetratricopeptide (TPR) repeat protein